VAEALVAEVVVRGDAYALVLARIPSASLFSFTTFAGELVAADALKRLVTFRRTNAAVEAWLGCAKADLLA
jgi:hypothetical protein